MNKPIIALDADGVLLDFNSAYAVVWERAFGTRPAVQDPHAYWAIDRFGLERLEADALAHFRGHFDEGFWATVPAIEGAVEACFAMADAGYELVCVSALPTLFAQARLDNLRALGFPIERVLATGHEPTDRSPKAQALDALSPVAFVDDYMPFMRGIKPGVHKALVMRGRNGTPNHGPELEEMHSMHSDLEEFSQWWLSRPDSALDHSRS